MEPGEPKVFTLAEYLELEASSQVRYEYKDGYVWAMSGGTHSHGKIVNNVNAELNLALRDQDGCESYSGDVKITIDEVKANYYPDATVVCGEIKPSDKDPHSITNPILLVEVLSKSTEAFDRGEKFIDYRHLPTFTEYLLIAQDRPIVEVFY